MRTYRVIIEGVAPIRMNKYVHEMDNSTKKSDKERQEEAYQRTYKDEKGKYVIPRKAIKAVIVAGGAKVSVGRGKAKALLKAVLFIEADVLLKYPKTAEILMQDGVKIPPRTGARVMKYWVAFKEWSAEFDIVITDDTIREEVIRNSIIAGGIYHGLLDGRPDFGRYILKDMALSE